MPDWSYRTLFRPALFALPPRFARDLALVTIGTLARSPLGPHVIDFMGHMRPAAELQRTVLGRRFAAPIGFSAELDPRGYGLAGLVRFGVGFVEIGPVTLVDTKRTAVRRDDAQQAILVEEGYPRVENRLALARVATIGRRVPVIVRLEAGDDAGALAKPWSANPFIDVAAFALERIAPLVKNLPADVPVLLALMGDVTPDVALHRVRQAREQWPRCDGVLVIGALSQQSEHVIGAPTRAPVLALVQALREAHSGTELAIIAGGGVHEPQHALDLFTAGADLVHVDSGLVFSGPGLVKRINEAVLSTTPAVPRPETPEQPARLAWFWMWLMGLAMFGGGALALAIAGTRVVLPYDEHFVGMGRAELDAINPRLLSFMSHDRVTLAGTMLSLGILYSGLAWHGVRRGLHWAWMAVLASALTGFLSFFSFLGFGYFEPFHAFVTALLFQLLLLSWHAPLGKQREFPRGPLVEDWRWRRAQWGQLLLVIEALAVITAGVVISIVGSTSIFVAEDLAYMNTCSADLAAANPRLLALIAHDRATFGGMLVSCGLTTLMATLWGFAAGRSWLFSTLAFAGTIGYVCAISVHYAVGYVDLKHLLPAFGGLALHLLAMSLSAPYLLWKEYRSPPVY
jgi:dihydroorotate dehydrogenase